MDDGRRYQRDQVYVRDWDTFKKVWKSTDFIKAISQLPLHQCTEKLREKLIELIKNDSQQCLVFNEHLKPEHLKCIVDLVNSEEFKMLLDYEHEGMFLGKAKQLIVYKKRASVATYLSKYRPPTEYKNMLAQILELGKDHQKLVIDKNVRISMQSSTEQIEQSSAKILVFKNEKLEPKLKVWRDLVNRMFEDFKNQPKKQEMLYLGVNSIIYEELKLLCEKYELYIGNRYQNISESDEYRDISITKYDRNNSSAFDDNSSNSLEGNEVQQPEGEIILQQEKQIEIQVPKNVRSVTLRKFSEKGAVCLIEISSFGIINPVSHIRIRLQSPVQTQQQKSYEQKIQVSQSELNYEVELPCLADGCSTFQISTVNDVGCCKKPEIFKVWMERSKNQQIGSPNYKLKVKNHCLYILGQNDQGLIPNWSNENNHIIRTTDQQWGELKFAGAQFSVSTHATICNKQGQVASWGKMYYFDEAGEFQDPKDEDEEDDDLGLSKQLKPETFRTQNPSLILNSKFIRKVSCGDGYCLMADSFGKAWSFGINTFGQLGLEHTSQNVDTSEPTLIPYFAVNSNIFVADVTASYFGASFAIDDKGKAYRWGTNQIQQSNRPVKDSFNNIINFEYPDIVAAQSIPSQISSRLISDKIKSIHPGFQFVLVLTDTDKVYGWGKTKFLGLGIVEDAHFKQIDNFCNPVHIMHNIKGLEVGLNHCLALSTKGELLGWGQSKYYQLKDQQREFVNKPQVILQNAASLSCKCGPNFTVYYYQAENEVKVIGNKQIFKCGTYKLPCHPIKIEAGEGVIMIMGDPITKPKCQFQTQVKKQVAIVKQDKQ